jgi:hypothetical protein
MNERRINHTDLFRDALVKVLVIVRTGARDEAAWNEVQAIVSKAFDDARKRVRRPSARRSMVRSAPRTRREGLAARLNHDPRPPPHSLPRPQEAL